MEGFRYITKEYNIDTNKIEPTPSLKKVPLMHPEISEKLLFQELDFNKM